MGKAGVFFRCVVRTVNSASRAIDSTRNINKAFESCKGRN